MEVEDENSAKKAKLKKKIILQLKLRDATLSSMMCNTETSVKTRKCSLVFHEPSRLNSHPL